MQASITKPNGDNTAPAGPAIPSSLKFGQWATLSAHAEKDVTRISPSNEGTFNPSTNKNPYFKVRVGKGFTDISKSYFEFVFKNKSGVEVQLDGGAHAIVSNIKITNPPGGLIEEVRESALLATVLKQYKHDPCDLKKLGLDEMFIDSTQISSKAFGKNCRDPIITSHGYDPHELPRITESDNPVVQRRLRFHPTGGFFNPKLGKQLTPGLAYDVELELAPAVQALTHRRQLDVYPLEPTFNTVGAAVDPIDQGAPAEGVTTGAVWYPGHGLAVGDQIKLSLNGNTWSHSAGTAFSESTTYYVCAVGVPAAANVNYFGISTTYNGTGLTLDAPTVNNTNPISFIVIGNGANATELDYEISEVRLMMPTTKILDPALAATLAKSSAKRNWTSDSYFLSTHQVPAAPQDTLSFPIPSSERLLKGIFCVVQESGQRSRSWVYSNTARSINYFTEWQLDKYGDLIPERKIQYASGRTPGINGAGGDGEKTLLPGTSNYNVSEGWQQAISLFGEKTGLVTAAKFGGSEDQQGCGVLAVNLQPFPGDESIISGTNTQMVTGGGDMRLITKTITAPLTHLATGTSVFGADTLVGTMWCFRVAAVAYFINEMGHLQARF